MIGIVSGMEIVDTLKEESYSANEVIRCIQVGLLCVQQRMEDRPIMSSVLLMLSTENAMVPQPKEPGFCTKVSSMGIDTSSSGKNPLSANEITVTALETLLWLQMFIKKKKKLQILCCTVLHKGEKLNTPQFQRLIDVFLGG